MKSLKSLPLLFVVVLVGCYSFNSDLLKAGNLSVSDRILPLKVGLAEDKVVRSEEFKGPQYQSDLTTVFERELEKNVFEDQPGAWGFIELKSINDTWKYTGFGQFMAVLSGISLYTLDMLGMPENEVRYSMEIEIAVLDKNKERVKKFTYEGTKNSVVGPFYHNGGAERRREMRIELFQELLSQFKHDVGAASERINSRLEEAGRI